MAEIDVAPALKPAIPSDEKPPAKAGATSSSVQIGSIVIGARTDVAPASSGDPLGQKPPA
jgi:hypothetical protein